MPVYNGEKYLAETINSILNQTYKDFEFLIIDDYSNDSSVEIINSFNDERILLMKNPENKGQSVTMNRGLQLAKGKYIARQDQDDISNTDRLRMQIDCIENSEFSVVGSWCEKINSISELIGYIQHPQDNETIISSMVINSPLSHSAVLMKKDDIIKVGMYSADYTIAMDWDLWIKMAKVGFKFSNIPLYLIKLRSHDEQTNKNKKYIDEKLIMLDKSIKTTMSRQYIDYNRAWKLFYLIKEFRFKEMLELIKKYTFYKVIHLFILFFKILVKIKLFKRVNILYNQPIINIEK